MEEKKHIYEGKTTTEAIEKGLKDLKLKKEEVEINILKDEQKRSFFNILEPRVIRVELVPKEKKTSSNFSNKEKQKMSEDGIKKAKDNLKNFLEVFIKQFTDEEVSYKIINDEYYITVEKH